MSSEYELLTEEQVKEIMGIKDFRHITKKKLMSVVSSLQNLDLDTAADCIAQFPEFNTFANKVVDNLIGLYKEAINSNKHFQERAVSAYENILQSLKEELKSADLSYENKRQISADMLFVAEKIEHIGKDHQNFIEQIVKYGSVVATGVVAIGAAILGVKFFDDDHLLK